MADPVTDVFDPGVVNVEDATLAGKGTATDVGADGADGDGNRPPSRPPSPAITDGIVSAQDPGLGVTVDVAPSGTSGSVLPLAAPPSPAITDGTTSAQKPGSGVAVDVVIK